MNIALCLSYAVLLGSLLSNPGRASSRATKNSTHGLMAIFPLLVEINLVKYRRRFGGLPRGKRPTLGSGRNVSEVFKIKDDVDDDDDLMFT